MYFDLTLYSLTANESTSYDNIFFNTSELAETSLKCENYILKIRIFLKENISQ
jgi:hypothetical protein